MKIRIYNLQDFLEEATHHDLKLKIDKQFHHQGEYERKLISSKLQGFDGDTLVFIVTSNSKNHQYENRIQFLEFDSIVNSGKKPIEIARDLMKADVKVSCNCKDFKYRGYQYISTSIDAAIEPMNIFPIDRNPELRGVVCKHLNRTISVLPFNVSKIASLLKSRNN